VKQRLIIYERGRKEAGPGRPPDNRQQTTNHRQQATDSRPQTIDNPQVTTGTWNLKLGTRAKPG